MCKLALLGVVMFGIGCGADQRKCNSSAEARARGDYDQGPPADLEHSYACASACYDLYDGEGWSIERNALNPVCVESALIGADRDPTKTADVRKACDFGSNLACKWLLDHKGLIADAEAARARKESDERALAEAAEAARPKMSFEDATAAIARVGDQLVREAPSSGYRLDIDEVLDVSDGGGVVPWNYSAGAQYRVYAISGHSTSFTVTFGGVGVGSSNLPIRALEASVFARSAEQPIASDVTANLQIYVRDAGGDRHPVRVLVFRLN